MNGRTFVLVVEQGEQRERMRRVISLLHGERYAAKVNIYASTNWNTAD